jgi:hypothetical protein
MTWEDVVRAFIGQRSRRLIVVSAALFVVAGGVAYATIPDSAQPGK